MSYIKWCNLMHGEVGGGAEGRVREGGKERESLATGLLLYLSYVSIYTPCISLLR